MNQFRGSSITTSDRHRRGVILVLTGAALWSMGGLLLRIIDVDELTTIFRRAVFAVMALSIYLLRVR